jgi:hypothetical protein
LIIALSGLAGAGKDTVADLLVKRRGFVKVGLADPIKRQARELWSFSPDQLWGPSSARNAEDPRYPGLSPRVVLQTIGSDVRRIDADAWARRAVAVASELLSDSGRCKLYDPAIGSYYDRVQSDPARGVVVNDLRYLNEAAAFRRAGGRVVRIVRAGAGLAGTAAQHASERELNEQPDSFFDAVIDNDGTIAELEVAMSLALESLR